MSALDLLPPTSGARLGVHVRPAALRRIRAGSPWVFADSIDRVTGGEQRDPSEQGQAGHLAVVFDDARRFAAIGLWDPESTIRVRLLHRGAPVPIDEQWWRERIDTALDRRRDLLADPQTTACRLIHGENDGLPALMADRYGRTLVLKVYSAAWFPWLSIVVPVLLDRLDRRSVAIERLVLRTARRVRLPDALDAHAESGAAVLIGQRPDGPVRYRERGLLFEADVMVGNKTGAFLDQRENRALVRSMSAGVRMLDVFANTGGFALAAAAGGAHSVHLVDQSEPAMQAARRNLALNRAEAHGCETRFSVGDAFDVLHQLAAAGERYDLVVIDPPSFAASSQQVPAAERAYRRLVLSGLRVLEPGGVLVQASCSSRIRMPEFADLVLGAARDHAARVGGTVTELRRTGHPVDHPIGFEFGEYLKAVYLSVG